MRLDNTEALDDFQLLQDSIFCNCSNDDPDCPECFGEDWNNELHHEE